MPASFTSRPQLSHRSNNGVSWWADPTLASDVGVVFGFTERGGGISRGSHSGLDLAAHVGDDPVAVDFNRTMLLESMDLNGCRDQLTCAEQVHGEVIAVVGVDSVGAGAYAKHGAPPIPGTDALITDLPGVPLLLCFADCVPVVLVAPGPVIGVVHAGWRGALASLPGSAVRDVARLSGCSPGSVRAYIGPHICAAHYDVDHELLSRFARAFTPAVQGESGGLDLEIAVIASLVDAGMEICEITALGMCTAEHTDLFFSYRQENGLTGRHGAVVCIKPF